MSRVNISLAHSESNGSTTSSRDPTNTLILTAIPQTLLNDPQPLVTFLAHENNFIIELVALPKFGRILIICETSQVSTQIWQLLKEDIHYNDISISYSLRDNDSSILSNTKFPSTLPAYNNYNNNNNNNNQFFHIGGNNNMDYLELPSEAGSRRFLISPPISPHAEWNDFEREEDAPNKKAIHSPSELSHLLWERLGGFDSSVVRKYQGDDEDNEQELYQEQENQPPLNEVIDSPTQYDLNQNPEVLFEDRDRDVPAIILDSVRNAASTDTTTDTSQNRNFKLPKTTMPPLF